MSLIQAIDDLLDFVEKRGPDFSHEEIQTFYDLDRKVYELAGEQNLLEKFSVEFEMEALDAKQPLQPNSNRIQAAGHTKLPGEWKQLGKVFCSFPGGRWKRGLNILRKTTLEEDERRRKKRAGQTLQEREFISAIQNMHTGGQITPPSEQEIAQCAELSVKDVQALINSHFVSHRHFSTAWFGNKIGSWLAEVGGLLPESNQK